MIELPAGIMFDIDGTLTESKQPITEEMAQLVAALTMRMPVAIVSGAGLEQMQTQIVSRLPSQTQLKSLILFPTSGACAFAYKEESWQKQYSLALAEEEKEQILREAGNVLAHHPRMQHLTLYGDQVEDRESSIAVSLLGQAAPIDAKKSFDPDGSLRKELILTLKPRLPAFDLKLGGMTTIDITKQGIDKAYAVKQFSAYIDASEERMVYVGDALGEDGNDSAVLKTAIQTHAVKNPSDTEEFIRTMLAIANTDSK
jgi:phosphomannomutase